MTRSLNTTYASARRNLLHDASHHRHAGVSGSDIAAAWFTVLLVGAAFSSTLFG